LREIRLYGDAVSSISATPTYPPSRSTRGSSRKYRRAGCVRRVDRRWRGRQGSGDCPAPPVAI